MSAEATFQHDTYDVVVVGSGIAGVSAALAAAEKLGDRGTVLILDRAPEAEAGGNTKWTDAYFRMGDVYEPAESFAEDMAGFSSAPRAYVDALLERIPDTMEWVQSHGARFDARSSASYFVNSVRPRLRPRGGGEGLRASLLAAALEHGVEVCYDVLVDGLATDSAGMVSGVRAHEADASAFEVAASKVVIASGGFEGDTKFLSAQVGGDASTLRPIAPGTRFNRGEGLRAALEVGVAASGQWDNFHAEPIDPRSPDPEALVMVFPYGILVDRDGRRFLDEGQGTVDEVYEHVARTIWSEQDGSVWFITDTQLERVTDYKRGLLTTVQPVSASSVEELAEQLSVPTDTLAATIDDFNAATATDASDRYDWRVRDGVATTDLEPPKSNWALPLAEPPYIAYPVGCAIVFTFGGLATDLDGRALREDGTVVANLYAAGECTGLYHDKYTGGTSVLRGMIFGRAAGTHAAQSVSSSAGDGPQG